MKKVIGVGLILFAVLIGALLVLNAVLPDKPEHKKREAFDIVTESVVRPALKCPSTATFMQYEPHAVTIHENNYTVTAFVDSENLFGARVRSMFKCTIAYTNGNWMRVAFNFIEPKTLTQN